MRRAARTLVETLATSSGLTAAARRLHRAAVAVVAYHNVVPEDAAGRGDTSLHLPLSRFVEQIDRLAATHDIVDLRTVRSEPSSLRRPRAVITFDDAYRGAVTLALPELIRRDIPAVVFVSPGLLGDPSTWWDELGEAGRLSQDVRTEALHALAGSASAVRSSFMDDITLPPLPTSYGIVESDELMGYAGDGISLGSHSWHHEHLPALDGAELDRSLTRSLEWVRGFGDRACRWLALPYGAGSLPLARRALEIGYQGVLRIKGGLWKPASTTALVPRINVPADLTAAGLELRASGLR